MKRLQRWAYRRWVQPLVAQQAEERLAPGGDRPRSPEEGNRVIAGTDCISGLAYTIAYWTVPIVAGLFAVGVVWASWGRWRRGGPT